MRPLRLWASKIGDGPRLLQSRRAWKPLRVCASCGIRSQLGNSSPSFPHMSGSVMTRRHAACNRGRITRVPIPVRVSSVQNVAAALSNNGAITGTVIYFGHGAQQQADGSYLSLLAVGQGTGQDTNVSALNVADLSNTQLSNNTSLVLKTCHAGLPPIKGGGHSIAQLKVRRYKSRQTGASGCWRLHSFGDSHSGLQPGVSRGKCYTPTPPGVYGQMAGKCRAGCLGLQRAEIDKSPIQRCCRRETCITA
jgi:hypothetical protein